MNAILENTLKKNAFECRCPKEALGYDEAHQQFTSTRLVKVVVVNQSTMALISMKHGQL